MRVTFRFKLILLAGCAALTIALMVSVSEWRAFQHRKNLLDLERRLVPRIALALKLNAEFADLVRSFQDAAAAQEVEGLEDAAMHRRRIFELIAESGEAIEPSAAANLRFKVHDYYETGTELTHRLISAPSGEESVRMMRSLQQQKREVVQALQAATVVGEAELGSAFGVVQVSSVNSTRWRIAIAVVGLVALALLWLWASRQMLRGLTTLSTGLARFATGNFEQTIVSSASDELSDLAQAANSMAANLSELAAHRNRTDWLKSGQVELSTGLSGNLTVEQVATFAARCLAERISALAAAVYLVDQDGALGLCGHYADVLEGGTLAPVVPASRFAVGQGLLGEALKSQRLKIVSELPPHYFQVLSGLGSGYATHLALLPLTMEQKSMGVIEMALSRQPTALEVEFLASVQSALFVALQSAQAREKLDALFTETRQQAERLAAQEEELRLSNRELSAQQEEMRKTNEELEQQQKALNQRNSELDEARKRVQEKAEELGRVSAYKSQFLANMSHELRTPLNSMLLLSHLLAENEGKNLTEKQVDYCNTVHSAGEDLLELINQVLDLSKIEAGKQEVQVEEVEVAQVARSMRRVFDPLAREKHIKFCISIDPGGPTHFFSDRLRIERILTNLIGNAIKFTEHGQVELRIAEHHPENSAEVVSERRLEFAVSDSGIGIAHDAQERIFRPFEQIEATTARRYQGTGLGLAIVRESVNLLGGEISLTSEMGKGSTFRCHFPLKWGDVAGKKAAIHRDPPTSHRSSHQSGAGPLHVLVIEDDTILAEQLLSIIESRGLSGMIAETGESGLALAKQVHPAGIILDVKLPDVDGFTVMERLQNDPLTQHIPVHFLSALDAPENGLVRGAVGYLTKPATREELSEVVRGLVPVSQIGNQKILVVEDSAHEGKSVVALLQSDGLSADHVTSAEDALARLDAESFGCIILDLGLKEMDGLAFLEVLRNRPDFSQICVIVHTGRSLSRKESNRLQAYAQAIVVKDGRSSIRLLEEVRLFVHHVRDRVPAVDVASIEPRTSAEPVLNGLRVLLVEDDMRTVYSLSALLQSRGCQVLTAENGREALTVLQEHQDIQCVLTDIMMPEMDGYEMMGRLRADKHFKNLPVIALTAKAMSGERERCLAAGASEYLSKPVDSAQLLRTLHTWTNGALGEG